MIGEHIKEHAILGITVAMSGYSGYSGISGYSGDSGVSGYSGENPGASGYSGTSGYSGYSGITGNLNNIVEDTTPQLGGNLDVNSFSIVSVSDGNIPITPDGTGEVQLGKTNLQDNLLERPEIKDYGETVNPLGSVTGATSIDLTLGNIVTATTTGATAWTFSNPSPTGKACSFTLILTNGGSAVQTWPSPATKWAGGIAPILTTSGVDVLIFLTIDAGTTWRAVLSSKDSK